jgi:TonB family protein
MRVTGAQPGADWRNAFRAWLEANKRYPREAIEAGEDGSLQLHIVVDADGRVRSVQLRRPSASGWLNRSALAMFRGATLPPFPPGTSEPSATIDLTINYVLIR